MARVAIVLGSILTCGLAGLMAGGVIGSCLGGG